MLEAHNNFVDIEIIELVICLWLEGGFPSPLTVHIFRPRCCQDSLSCHLISTITPSRWPSQQDVIGLPQASLLQFILQLTCRTSTYLTSLFLGFIIPWWLSWSKTTTKKTLPANAGDERDLGLIPGSGRTPGEGHGNPLQYSCLENSMDRGAWQATVHGLTKSWTRLSTHTCTHTHTHTHTYTPSPWLQPLPNISPDSAWNILSAWSLEDLYCP